MYTSSEGRFSVLLPGTPKIEPITVNTAVGPIKTDRVALNKRYGAYNIVYLDYTEKAFRGLNTKTILDNCRDGMVSAVQGKLLTESIISLNNNPGRDFRVEIAGGRGTCIARLYLVGRRVYQITLATSKERSFLKDVSKYLDSFKLL